MIFDKFELHDQCPEHRMQRVLSNYFFTRLGKTATFTRLLAFGKRICKIVHRGINDYFKSFWGIGQSNVSI